MYFWNISQPDWLKEVSSRSKTEPLLPRIVGRGEVLVELLLRHHLLHLLEHPLLDEPLGVVWVSMKRCYRSKLFAQRSPCAIWERHGTQYS